MYRLSRSCPLPIMRPSGTRGWVDHRYTEATGPRLCSSGPPGPEAGAPV